MIFILYKDIHKFIMVFIYDNEYLNCIHTIPSKCEYKCVNTMIYNINTMLFIAIVVERKCIV